MLKEVLAQRAPASMGVQNQLIRLPTAPVNVRNLVAGLITALAVPFQASAANTEYSDLWWNPNESGWGVGMQRQDDVIFLTLFVYGADGNNTWFVAPNVQLLSADTPNSTWQGPLYSTTGPGFMTQFDQTVQATETGTATVTFANAESATLHYTVAGAQVTKQITRMTWRQPSAAGRYWGGFTTQIATCEGDRLRVGVYDFMGNMDVTQDGSTVAMAFSTDDSGATSTCTFTANARQAGRLGFWTGNYSCNIYTGCDGRCEGDVFVRRNGAFQMDDVALTQSGFHGVLTAQDQDCTFTGYLGGTRRP